MRGLSLVVACGVPLFIAVRGPLTIVASRCGGSRRAGSVVVAHGPSCSAACGIFPDQGSNPRPLHWQADSQPLHHQGSPVLLLDPLSSLVSGPHTSFGFFLSNSAPSQTPLLDFLLFPASKCWRAPGHSVLGSLFFFFFNHSWVISLNPIDLKLQA